jgi:hypothetical protein
MLKESRTGRPLQGFVIRTNRRDRAYNALQALLTNRDLRRIMVRGWHKCGTRIFLKKCYCPQDVVPQSRDGGTGRRSGLKMLFYGFK